MKESSLAQAMDLAPQERPLGAGFGGGIASALRRHWWVVMGVAALALGGVLAAGLHGGRLAAVVAPYPHELAQVSFAVAGDVIPHEPVRAAAVAAGEGAQG